jgi:DNA-binding NtrC family response regulator
LLVRHFVHKYSHFTGSMPFELSGEDIATLCEQDWPGNVRELENTTKRWLALRTRDVKSSSAPIASVASNTLPETDRRAEHELKEGEPTPEQILKTLDQFQWHRQKAAQALNMSYQALRRRIIKYRLDRRR